ncbi:MAG: hypothetical protein WBV82_09665, partial [Myxococcaceae bacterium]
APAPAPVATAQPAPQADPVRSKVDEGDQLMKAGDARGASFAYLDALNGSPNDVEANFKLGNAYAVLGYYAQAIQHWTKVTQLSTDATVRRSAEQNIAKAQSKLPAAAASAQAPVAAPASQAQDVRAAAAVGAPSTRGQARGLYEQGVQQINARDYAGALKSLSEALQLEPDLTVAYVARGSALIGLRRYSEAAADYDYAHRLDPSLSSPLYGLAEAYRVMGRSSDARRFYELYARSRAPDVRPELQARSRDWAAKLR